MPNKMRKGRLWIYVSLGCLILSHAFVKLILYPQQNVIGDRDVQALIQEEQLELPNHATYLEANAWLLQHGFEIENGPSGHWAGSLSTTDSTGHVISGNVVVGFKRIRFSTCLPIWYWLEFDFIFSEEPISNVIERHYTGGKLLSYIIEGQWTAPPKRLFTTQP